MVETTNRPKRPSRGDHASSVPNPSRPQREDDPPQRSLHPPQKHAAKTVHFETDVVTDRRDGSVGVTGGSSLPDLQFDRHVQQLFAFIGSALSAGRDHGCSDDDDDGDSGGGGDGGDSCNSDCYHLGDDRDCTGGFYGGAGCCGGDDDDRRSVSDDETARRRSSLAENRPGPAAMSLSRGARTLSFERDVDRGNLPFRHKHCKTTAGTCNRVFLKKVTTVVVGVSGAFSS